MDIVVLVLGGVRKFEKFLHFFKAKYLVNNIILGGIWKEIGVNVLILCSQRLSQIGGNVGCRV